jgi:hypothetical protein
MKTRLIIFLAIFSLQPVFTCVSRADNNSSREVIPRIDEEAAYTERSLPAEEKKDSEKPVRIIDRRPETTESGNIYSQNFWVFLLGAYLFLLVFNLSSNFKFNSTPGVDRIQWFWVSIFTFLAIFAWDKLDIPRTNAWFPKAVIEIGIIIYAFYLYFKLSVKSLFKSYFRR